MAITGSALKVSDFKVGMKVKYAHKIADEFVGVPALGTEGTVMFIDPTRTKYPIRVKFIGESVMMPEELEIMDMKEDENGNYW